MCCSPPRPCSYTPERRRRRRGVVREKDVRSRVRATAAVRPVPRRLARVERDSDARKQIVVRTVETQEESERENGRVNERAKRIILYTKTETGRVGRCSCCRRCHPLTTVVGVACVQRPGPVFCCGGGGGRVRRNKSRGGREGTCGGGDRVPLARTTVCVCARALFSRIL
ncbi:unnamed protein product [Aphis gossypii]|uniref:Uncharacterized protein n=1 Tax=Aphis gossypii TaxID=80765 RepID=A0A9P0IQ51_APHGO|nr:unnamed protein product [Aphis gossypii]